MIVGIDPSTSTLGVAFVDGTTATIRPRAKASDPYRRLDELERAVVREIRLRPPLPRLAVIEGPLPHSIGVNATLAVHAVRSTIALALYRLDVAVVLVSPSHLKRYATGNGSADKAAMIAAALAEGARIAEGADDEADAWHLRHLGRAANGLEPLTVPHRIEIAAAIPWPSIGDLDR